MVDLERFWRDGYLVIPKVLDPQVVLRWREAAFRMPNHAADLLTDPTLREAVLNDSILAVARAILGTQRPIYFGDSTAAVGKGGSGFHKDNSDRLDGNAPDWQEDRYPIIRFGVYTKPHGRSEPGSIEFRRGSHRIADFRSGERTTAATEPGDLVVWNGRTTHSGNARVARLFNWCPVPDVESISYRTLLKLHADRWLFKPESSERVALFVSYGKAHRLLDRHVQYLKSRAYPWQTWKVSHWTQETRQLAERAGLGLIDPTGFRWDGQPLNENWAPIPYDLPPLRLDAM